MAARTREEEQRQRWRRRLARGLVLGGAAVGIPAAANAWWRRKVAGAETPVWGRQEVILWRDGEVRVRHLGKGSPIVLLHSFGPGHDGGEWREVAELLAESFHVIVPDFLGWGRSDRPAIEYTAQLNLGLLGSLLDQVVDRPAVVLASGQSGAYACETAVASPSAVTALGLVAPTGLDALRDGPGHRGTLLRTLLGLPVLGDSAINVLTTRSGIASYLQREVFSNPERVDSDLVDRHFRSAHRTGHQRALSAHLAGRLYLEIGSRLDEVSIPVWLAWGRDCCGPAVETADFWLHRLPNAELEIFDDCGRLPHLEASAAFVERIRPFLERVTS